MPVITALAAFALLAAQDGGITVGGFTVPLRFPDAATTPVPEGYLAWEGWGYRNGDLSLAATPYAAVGDWKPFRDVRAAENAVPWRLRVILATRTDVLEKDAEGVLSQRRVAFDDDNVGEILQAVLRYPAVLAQRTGGRIKVIPDVSVEAEPLLETITPGEAPYQNFASGYVYPRINGGSYEAEDKVYRGPYHGVVVIMPPRPTGGVVDTMVGETPVRTLFLPSQTVVAGMVENALDAAFESQLATRAAQAGYRITAGAPSAVDLTAATNLRDPSAEDFASRGEAKLGLAGAASPSASTWLTRSTKVAFITDVDRGSVLQYSELNLGRGGGLSLPVPANGFSGGTLTFMARSKSPDPLALKAVGQDGKTVYYSLNRDFPSPVDTDVEASLPTPFVSDGTWQKISVDLRPVGKVAYLALEPTPRSRFADRRDPAIIRYDFDDFVVNDDPAPTPVMRPDPERDTLTAQARLAAAATKSGQASPELAALLKSPDAWVRLNALAAYSVVKDPSVEPDLEAATVTINLHQADLALRAIAFQGTEPGMALLKRTIRISPTDYHKGVAAELLGKDPKPGLQADLAPLVANRSWQTLSQAVRALAGVPGPEAGIVRMTFLFHDNPAVKFVATETSKPSEEYELRKMLWSAVNEPWDAVRAMSNIKLIQARQDQYRTEGYKGVRDDSVGVRLAIVNWLGQNPAEAHVPALKLALSDSSYRVRAAALDALATQPGTLKVEDVQAVIADKFPPVRAALERLAKAKGLVLG